MSQSLLARPATDRRPSVDPEDVLAALSDTDCRRILDATSTPLTAREISEACDLPSSTTYRKIDLLTDAGLVEERLRLDSTGKYPHEYQCSIDNVVVHLAENGGVEIGLDGGENL